MTMWRNHFNKTIVGLLVVCGLVLIALPTMAASARSTAPAGIIPAELKGLDIKDYYTGSGSRDAGVIQTVVGYVVVAREGLKQAYYAAAGDRLFEKDVIFTLKESRCRFQLKGQDVVTMGDNTRLGIKTAVENTRTQTKQTVFSVLRGKAMFYAIRLFKYRNVSMEVETPTAVSGVRGTKWGVEVVDLAGKPLASLPVLVADRSPEGGFRHLAQQSSPNYQTNFYTFEGSVFVNSLATGQSVTLTAGQGVAADKFGLGKVFPVPPDVLRQFLINTSGQDTVTPPPSQEGDTSLSTRPLDTTNIIQKQREYQQKSPQAAPQERYPSVNGPLR
jgi:FecR protein